MIHASALAVIAHRAWLHGIFTVPAYGLEESAACGTLLASRKFAVAVAVVSLMVGTGSCWLPSRCLQQH